MAQANNGSTTNFTEIDSLNGFRVNGTQVIDSSGQLSSPVITGPVIAGTTTSSSGAGAVAITGAIHEITTGGIDALTLADGTEGQRLAVVMVADGGNGTLTPSNFASGSTITFDGVGDTADLLFTGGSWFFMGGTATVA